MLKEIIGGSISVQVIQNNELRELLVPVYNILTVPKNHCARYARLAAWNLFGISYEPANAWDFRYKERVAAEVNGKGLKDFLSMGVLKSGMIIGFFNPESHNLERKDLNGNKVKYTHVAIYLGNDQQSRMKFAHQFGFNTSVIASDEFEKDGLRAVEIIEKKDPFYYIHD